MRKTTLLVVMWTAACLVLGTGCLKKPKIDLTGIRDAPPTSVGPGDAPFVPLADSGAMDFEPIGTGDGSGGADGAWSSTDQPLGAGNGNGTIEPVQKRWADVVVYFAYDSAVIGPAERPKLTTLAEHLRNHPQYTVIIEGHCDERGSDEYNRGLGETRALVVRDFLLSQGIAAERLETVSYGEERPVVANATTESEHQKNRRAEFVIGIRR